ncbi:MAG: mechanosensitive ion channel [Bdellovibrio sp.]
MPSNDLNALLEFGALFKFRNVLYLLFGIGMMIWMVRFLQERSRKLYERFPTKRLLILQVITILTFFIYIFGTIFLIMNALRPPKELLIALGGSAAVAVGFAVKDIFGSLVAGLILLFDRPFQVGDRVKFGDIYGEIKSIGLRAVRLTTLDDSLVTIPNLKFITDAVSSGNAGALDMMIEIPFYISLSEDVKKVRDLLYEIVVTSRFVFLKKPVTIVVKEVEVAGRLAYRLTVKAYVLDVRYEKAFETDVTMRASRHFQELEIKRPELIK